MALIDQTTGGRVKWQRSAKLFRKPRALPLLYCEPFDRGAALPDELWSAAIEVACREGVTRTATVLGLDGGKLKRLMMAADGVEKSPRRYSSSN